MQTVPSLVGTGTAIAAAANGLVFGEPTEFDPPPTRPVTRREVGLGERSISASQLHSAVHSTVSSRPGTSSAARPSTKDEVPSRSYPPHTLTSSRPPLSRHQRPQTAQITPPKTTSRRQSFVRQGDLSTPAIAEARDSFSSNGSWMRRLSIRPLSQHGSPSPRSSIGPDSHSIAFSHGSAAPILSRPSPSAPTLPPNKLVKRTSSIQYGEPEPLPRRRSSHLPTLRRPATSHQRSATLHQFNPDFDLESPLTPAKYSFDQQGGFFTNEQSEEHPTTAAKAAWISFFHSRTSNSAKRTSSSRLSDFSPSQRTPTKRICVGSDQHRKVHLVNARMVTGVSSASSGQTREIAVDQTPIKSPPTGPDGEEKVTPGQTTPSKQLRRSISVTFSSAGNWVSRTSGSIRRPKRGADGKGGNKRYVSDPVGGANQSAVDPAAYTAKEPTIHPPREKQGSLLDSAATSAQVPNRKRNSSSPLPPLSRLSTFHVDLSRSGPTGSTGIGGASTLPARRNQPSGSSTSSAAISQLKSSQQDRSSIVGASEADTREFTSGDDDDTDFKSDTMFDSVRTGASGRVRAVETPLDSMYDESPPSTAGNSKTKRLSIQEILGRDWDEDNRIMEEDENAPTIIRAPPHRAKTESPTTMRFALQPSPADLPVKDFGRLSLEDDFDEDWTRDDDVLYNPLSPPSKGSSVNSKGMNPNVRLALASIGGNAMPDSINGDGHNERPLSNLFDWSEPSQQDKLDGEVGSLRPKTAYAKHEVDSRGGRSAIRKGPTPTHVRSQSVPVVHDVSDEAKPTGSKYGTWGLGTKTVSEDWDDDFEFGGGEPASDGKTSRDLFAVPESIQATQPSVRAHSGQIRELSLLVNDLKRLCRHGKEMNMLDGPYKTLWRETEGIIALASPDEDDEPAVHNDADSTASSADFDAFDAKDRFFEEESDAASLERLDAAMEGREPTMTRTTVVRERQSPRRRSVFSPDDDIFGCNWPPTEATTPSNRPSRPRTPDGRANKPQDVNKVVRSVMEAMQLRPASEVTRGSSRNRNRMHFDTNSLKVLVKRAGDLRDVLSDIVRRADQLTQSPARTPRRERHAESSPAFTRVFDDPTSSPPRRVPAVS